MKKIILILILFLSSNVFPQSGWVTVSTPFAYNDAYYAKLEFVDENTGYLIRDKVYKSTNGGVNWFPVTTTISDNSKMKFFNSGTGYVLLGGSTQIAKTTNGGTNWKAITFGNNYLSDMKFVNESTGFVIYTENQYSDTVKGYILKTTDAGNTWNKYLVRSDSYISYLDFCNAQTGYIWGDFKFFKTTNGGINWAEVDGDNILIMLFKFRFTTDNTGWAITDTFRITKTTNGGVNWVKQYQLSKARDIFFINQNTGWYCYDKIYKTTNAGESWAVIRDSTGIYYKMNFINENTGWCYTSTNKLLITHNGGSVFIEKENEEMPSGYLLYNNYPNPFNPDTKIKFNIPQKEFVKLTVYNITGEIVSTLVNGNLSAGIYKVDFSGKDLSSGTYFYKIESGNFRDVKRMILIK